MRNRLRRAALYSCRDESIEVYDLIQRLHLDGIGGAQLWMLIEESLYIRGDFRISGAAAESAVFICCASLQSAGKNRDECKCPKYWFVSDHGLSLLKSIYDALCHANPVRADERF
jgi:hypothetical protein